MIPTENDLEPCPWCRRAVLVTTTGRGRRLAVDPIPNAAGNAAVWRDGAGTWRSRSLAGREAMPLLSYEDRLMPHVATSPGCRPAPPASQLPGLATFTARSHHPARLPRPDRRTR
ncbi:hypothetical protein FHS43_000546 [Streptosporangium becharense]|uniref:Uncharacterized protein n=1 Tax=Streptosporangium becharense TaxID=1816182 RepID=A0A7W9MJZ7_9ACTN|nr:hypothetical protein [Streptosporangium becharense]MBB2909300.1 hypothetical protein [Streptosporangium becharense]MBB5823797.1 hypothetical protein [Streptosporangium becharense]